MSVSHDFLHRASWRAFRLGALIIGLPVAAVLVSAAALLWRLSTGPLDVTRIADHFAPVAIQPGLSLTTQPVDWPGIASI